METAIFIMLVAIFIMLLSIWKVLRQLHSIEIAKIEQKIRVLDHEKKMRDLRRERNENSNNADAMLSHSS